MTHVNILTLHVKKISDYTNRVLVAKIAHLLVKMALNCRGKPAISENSPEIKNFSEYLANNAEQIVHRLSDALRNN